MKRLVSPLLALPLFACTTTTGPQPAASQSAPETATYRLENGLWFDGQGFAGRSVDIVDGRFAAADPARAADQTLDLDGGYVIPPLCDAHNHNLGDSADPSQIKPVIDAYIQYGVFYVMMQGSFDLYRDQLGDRINHPGSIDVTFANNGLTGSGGHPRSLRESLMERYGKYPEFTPETLPDAGYFEADTRDDVREKMALIIAEEPDFIKVMLFFSEDYAQRKDDPDYYGQRGLNPDFLPEVVRLAHAADLRVSVHVESDADMATALRAGADMIAHLPSYDYPAPLSEETIALAVETQAALITTFSLAKRMETRDPDLYEATLDAQRENLRRLHAAGANLVIGSDNVRDVSYGEALHLESLNALDNRTLLSMWTENCATTAFPERRIGRLDDGYEASLLVLDDNPLQSLSAVTTISLRMKNGALVEDEEPQAESTD